MSGVALCTPLPEGASGARAAADGAALVAQEPGLHGEHLSPGGGLTGCLACGHPELYTKRAFPRPLGIAIVVVAAVLAPWTMYLSLVAAAVLDFAIYHLAPNVVCCYVCEAEHRGFPADPPHPRYDITIAERLKYGERAVMGSAMREGGTANAPDPEH